MARRGCARQSAGLADPGREPPDDRVGGPAAGLAAVDALDAAGRLAGHHRLYVVRAHLLEMAGDRTAAVENYRAAAARTASTPEYRYLSIRAARLGRGAATGGSDA